MVVEGGNGSGGGTMVVERWGQGHLMCQTFHRMLGTIA